MEIQTVRVRRSPIACHGLSTTTPKELCSCLGLFYRGFGVFRFRVSASLGPKKRLPHVREGEMFLVRGVEAGPKSVEILLILDSLIGMFNDFMACATGFTGFFTCVL